MEQRAFRIPADVRPVTELARVDVLAWGLRSLVKPGLTAIACPSVQVECGGTMVETGRLSDLARHPNFNGLTRQCGRAVFEVDLDFDAALGGRPCPPSVKAAMDTHVRRGLQQSGVEVTYIEYLRTTVAVGGAKAAIERLHNALAEGSLVLDIQGRRLKARYGKPACLVASVWRGACECRLRRV